MVFERGQVGGGATGASAGMIQLNPDRNTPSSLSALQAESARLFPALATELLDRTGMDIGYRAAPLLHVALREAEEPRCGGTAPGRSNTAWPSPGSIAARRWI